MAIVTLPLTYQIANGQTADASLVMADLNQIATNVNAGALAVDGSTTAGANQPMGTFRHTGVGNAVSRTDYAAAGQIQDGSLIWCGTAGGTANALTLTAAPIITAVAAGMTLRFKAGASNNSAATTVVIGSAPAIAIQVNGAACTGGEILANKWYQVTVDAGLTTCQLLKLGRITPTELGITAFAQTLLDDPDAATMIATLGTFANAGMASWTPTISGSVGGVGVYTVQVGRYLAIGNLIIATAYVGFDINTLSGNLSISLPVTSENVTNSYVMGLCTYWGGFATAMTRIGGFAPPNSSTFALHKMTGAATSSSTALVNTDCDASQEFMFVFAYFKP